MPRALRCLSLWALGWSCLTVAVQAQTLVGDPQRGRAIVTDRQRGACLLCHSGDFPEERFQGNLAPALGAASATQGADALRMRLMDPTRYNPQTIMPRYGTPTLGVRVHPQFQGQNLLQPQDIEDVVAFLMQLKP